VLVLAVVVFILSVAALGTVVGVQAANWVNRRLVEREMLQFVSERDAACRVVDEIAQRARSEIYQVATEGLRRRS
jgi:hypothetical protein